MKKILYAAAECAPFVKTGGLGTVVGSVPKALCEKGYDVRVVMPRYACIGQEWKKRMKRIMVFPVFLGWRFQPAELYEMELDGVIIYFIGNDFYLSDNSPYSDLWLDVEKFSYFNKALLELISYLDFNPDIIHCHDWHTGLVPVYLRTEYGDDPFYQKIRTVMTIHNLKFQGKVNLDHFKDVSGLPDYVFTIDRLLDDDCGSMLKGGLAYADRITTVSDSYAKEIMEPEYGEGLDGLLRFRRRDLSGIVNGIDTQIYNPSLDQDIEVRYNIDNFKEGKRQNKISLQRLTGMPENPDVFTVAIISRLTDQKGFDLLGNIIDRIMEREVQIYILGSGEEHLMEMFSQLQKRYPRQIYLQFDYNDPLAKKMYAGCDAVLMPSRFEPCGLSQMMAFAYGTVPIVRLTGGLADTVRPFHEEKNKSTGFGFREFKAWQLAGTLEEALTVYYDHRRAWDSLAGRCMKEDYSWENQSGKYVSLYESIA